MKYKTQHGWAVYSPTGKIVHESIQETKGNAKYYFMHYGGLALRPWPEHHANGFRCKGIEIRIKR